MIIIDSSVFKRGAKLEIEKVFSKHLRIKIIHMNQKIRFNKKTLSTLLKLGIQ